MNTGKSDFSDRESEDNTVFLPFILWGCK